ncbi:MAG: hypothetical protein ACREP6_08080 [Candidatus Binataceae bacterium]
MLGITLAPATRCYADNSVITPVENYFATWFDRVNHTQAEQPHWITPLVTVTPRLEEEFRYDQIWQTQPVGRSITNYGGSKGLELIPFEHIETILGVPGYISHGGKPRGANGWADWTFLLKYRLLAANEESGNYILTLFMGISAPTGDDPNSTRHAVYSPQLAFGKGWGNFDFQSTVGVALPNGGLKRLGMPVAYNTAFQYHIPEFLAWPELEVNYTWWPNGEREGKSQVFLTPGIVFGRLPIWRRLGLTFGVGYQVAVTDDPQYNNGVILSIRTPF